MLLNRQGYGAAEIKLVKKNKCNVSADTDCVHANKYTKDLLSLYSCRSLGGNRLNRINHSGWIKAFSRERIKQKWKGPKDDEGNGRRRIQWRVGHGLCRPGENEGKSRDSHANLGQDNRFRISRFGS